ncbi:hypothetical protein HHI36_000984 [Cryptolaemus montrouzieri]|uniref:Uncharacterized protein n=1 Tax=Cryptolaemus montrouzieri TaxID=559131 RepID=A0ABD2P6W6_9CUCU
MQPMDATVHGALKTYFEREECTPEPEPGCSQIVSAFVPDIAAQKSDTVVPDDEENTSRDNSPNPKPECSASHYSSLVLSCIANPAKPMTTRKKKLQKSEILTSTRSRKIKSRNM